jgi:hypothetical protein
MVPWYKDLLGPWDLEWDMGESKIPWDDGSGKIIAEKLLAWVSVCKQHCHVCERCVKMDGKVASL